MPPRATAIAPRVGALLYVSSTVVKMPAKSPTQEILLLERPIENADNEMVMVVKPALQSKRYVAIRTLIVKEKPATTKLSTHMPQPIQCLCL